MIEILSIEIPAQAGIRASQLRFQSRTNGDMEIIQSDMASENRILAVIPKSKFAEVGDFFTHIAQ